MEEKEMDKKLEKDIQDHIKNKKIDYTKYKRTYRGVYNRKILRNIIKHQLKTNKIRNAWHQLRAEGRV